MWPIERITGQSRPWRPADVIVRSLIDQNPGELAFFAEGPGIREDKGFTTGSDQKGFDIG
jgi:hypothetical protein